MTFQEIIDYCKAQEKRKERILFRVRVTTNLGDFDHILCPKYYERHEKGIINILCDFIAYTRKLGSDKRFSLNEGDFDSAIRKCRVTVAQPSDLSLYVNGFISDKGKEILSTL